MAHVTTYESLKKEWESSVPWIEARTSGSTGRPKTIRLPKDFVRASARRTNTFFSIGAASRLHSCVSPEFIGGKMMGIRAWEAGASLTWETPSNDVLRGAGPAERIDLLAVVPSQMLSLLGRPDQLPEIGAIIIGGSAIDLSLARKTAASGLKAYETYGMTETASHIALRPLDGTGSPFRVLPGVGVGTDRRGCLEITFGTGEIIVTNDLAEVEGDSFRILGRTDNVIVTGGRKVSPEDVERKIGGLITRRFMIDWEPDEKWGQKVVLRIEGGLPDADRDLMRNMKELLDPWERPKSIFHVGELPRTASGKVLRKNKINRAGRENE